MHPNYFKPSFILSIALLIWFFLPGESLGWTVAEGYSGFDLVRLENAYMLLIIPLCAGYLIMGNITGELSLERYAKRGILLGVGLFLIASIFTRMSTGFFVATIAGCYLWWETLRKSE